MNYILFDDETRANLLPLTLTRPVSEIRIGILKITEKWQHYLNDQVSFLTEKYLSRKYNLLVAGENLLINGSILPDKGLLVEIMQLKNNQQLVKDNKLIAAIVSADKLKGMTLPVQSIHAENIEYSGELCKLNNLWDIFILNDKALRDDFKFITQNRKSAPISSSNNLINPDGIFLEEGVKMECSIVNASTGPVYLGKEAEVMEGTIIRGPFALGENAVLKMGAKIYGATTVGPYSKVGGEVSNSVIFGYSNKAHDGFLGNSILGEWCNLGADTNTSNLKNNYSNVKIWNYHMNEFVDTGLQFCGLFMGDHSKCSINTMFNTGTVLGVSSNVFGSGFPEKYIPSFTWGGVDELIEFRLDKAIELATQVYKRRGLTFDEREIDIFRHLYMHK